MKHYFKHLKLFNCKCTLTLNTIFFGFVFNCKSTLTLNTIFFGFFNMKMNT